MRKIEELKKKGITTQVRTQIYSQNLKLIGLFLIKKNKILFVFKYQIEKVKIKLIIYTANVSNIFTHYKTT